MRQFINHGCFQLILIPYSFLFFVLSICCYKLILLAGSLTSVFYDFFLSFSRFFVDFVLLPVCLCGFFLFLFFSFSDFLFCRLLLCTNPYFSFIPKIFVKQGALRLCYDFIYIKQMWYIFYCAAFLTHVRKWIIEMKRAALWAWGERPNMW